MPDWLAEEGDFDPEMAFDDNEGARSLDFSGEEPKTEPEHNIAVFLKPFVVLDTRKWFGGAELRLDAMVVHGGAEGSDLFQPKTIRFPRVIDGQDLVDSDNGLMVYYGKPSHFLVMSFMLSRDTSDSDDLAALIKKESQSDEVSSVVGQLATLATPHVAAVRAAMDAAVTLGEVAYKLVRQVSPKSLGLFRANWLGQRDNFGIGRHPENGSRRAQDFEFAYEIVEDKPA